MLWQSRVYPRKSIHLAHHTTGLKEEKHKIISQKTEKPYDKIQRPFVIKIIGKPGIQHNFFKVLRDIHK